MNKLIKQIQSEIKHEANVRPHYSKTISHIYHPENKSTASERGHWQIIE